LRTVAAERSWCIGADGRTMARFGSAFVDISTAVSNECVTGGALALAVDADLTGCTVALGPTTRSAPTVDTHFSGQAIVIAVTDFDATTGFAPLSLGTVGVGAASWVAATAVACHSSRTRSRVLAEIWCSHTTLLGSRTADKSFGTLAEGRTLHHFAASVDATDAFALARTFAAAVEAGFTVGTVAVGPAAALAHAIDASLLFSTLIVSQTLQQTNASDAALTLGAIISVATHDSTLSVQTGSLGAVAVKTARLRLSDTAELGGWIGCKSRRATADGCVVDAPAGRVGSAVTVARVDATSV